MHAPPAERARRAVAMRQVLARTSWDATAGAMERLLDAAIARSARPGVPSAAHAS
jgi:hypothetical protein